MHYFYHAVPEKMEGTALLPLSSITKQNSKLGNTYKEKYKGRKEVANQRIPQLDCTWSDVIQMIPLDPSKVFAAQQEMGIDTPALPKKYYKIPIRSLDPNQTIIFFKEAPGEKYIRYESLSEVDLADIQEVPSSTLVYYKMCAISRQIPFNFQFIPHVCYKGEIDVSTLEVVAIVESV